jgi:Tfp pilus assembly protein PilF
MLARANAYLQGRHSSQAVEEFSRVANLRKGFPADPAGALAELGLARAYAQAGDKDSARAAYHEFLTGWKDADPNRPTLQKAKAEYAHLQ